MQEFCLCVKEVERAFGGEYYVSTSLPEQLKRPGRRIGRFVLPGVPCGWNCGQQELGEGIGLVCPLKHRACRKIMGERAASDANKVVEQTPRGEKKGKVGDRIGKVQVSLCFAHLD